MASSVADLDVCPHDRFFFSDGSLYLLVENSLYCVHRYLFEIHASMFPVPELETSLSKPYVLGDVKKSDFDRLLANLYPRTLGVEEVETAQDWISVLALASKWGFNSLRSKAISKIEETLDSPVDMVTLGRQYCIPAFLLPGYAVLCQSTTPLSDDEGLRLGVEDVLKIYRIRHELYGSGATPVPFEVAFVKVKEAGLGDERHRQELEGEQASTWTDVGSVATSQTFTEKEERGAIVLTPNGNSPSLEVASTNTATLVSERPEQRHIDAHSPSNKRTLAVILGNGSVTSSVFPGNISNPDSESSGSDREGFKLLDELTTYNFDLVFVEIMQWIDTKDNQTLHQITQLIVEKALNTSSNSPFAYLCKAMIKYIQPRHQMARLIVGKAMEEPRLSDACAQLCHMMIKENPNSYPAITTADGLLFGKYLGEICQENLEAIAASIAGTGEPMARTRRLRLVEFIGRLAGSQAADMWAPTIIDKWVTALLDANDEEKVAILCMTMTRVGQLYASQDMNKCLQKVKKVAQETSNPRVRKLLQSVSMTDRHWNVAEPSFTLE